MRFHVVGLPAYPVTRENNACAYTSKVYKFCQMMISLGHEVFLYGVEGSDAPCSKFFSFMTRKECERFFPTNLEKTSPMEYDSERPYWKLANSRTIKALWDVANRKDFLCLIAGYAQKPLHDHTGDLRLMTVEYGVGYYGVFSKYRCFESYSHMHHVYGRLSWQNGKLVDYDGQNFDCVIPNYWDVNDFPVQANPSRPPYFLFMGRMIRRKGLQEVMEITKAAGVRLILTGQNAKQEGDRLTTDDGQVYEGDHFRYVGYSNVRQRGYLMANASGILCPTKYLGPFEGVNVESQLCGTPAITSDYGAFTETVVHGVTGYRCRTLEQYVWAIKNVHKLNRSVIAERARKLYSLERCAKMYQEWFEMLRTLWDKGWYAENPNRTELDWLNG